MARQIYVNLAIRDMQKSRAFFASLGFAFEPKFTNDSGACMVIAPDIYVMLLVEPFFATFTKKPLCDARTGTEVLICLSCDSRAEVDDLIARAVAAGGGIARPAQELGFMYSHAFEDLDGHIWELVYMDPAPSVPQN